MPRLTNQDFFLRRRFLKSLWLEEEGHFLFSLLDVNAQMDLHEYYRIMKTGSAAEIIDACRSSSSRDSSLPNRAGKSFRQLQECYCHAGGLDEDVSMQELIASVPHVTAVLAAERQRRLATAKLANHRSVSKGSHRLSAIVRPDIDKEAFARILLELAQLRVDEERAAKESEKDSTTDV